MADLTAPICLKPRFSKRFALVLIIIHNGALLLLLPLTLPFAIEVSLVIKLCLGLLIIASAWHTTRRHLRSSNHPLYGCILRYDEAEHCVRVQLKFGEGAQIALGSYSHPQLVVLRLKGIENGRIDTLIIWRDALDRQTFRQLRVHLRHADDPEI
jgi:hypothetical protein